MAKKGKRITTSLSKADYERFNSYLDEVGFYQRKIIEKLIINFLKKEKSKLNND